MIAIDRVSSLVDPKYLAIMLFCVIFMSVMIQKVKSKTIDSIRVLEIENRSFPSGTLLLLFNVGSRDEPKHLAGIAHFFEHIVFKGTVRFPTYLDISLAVENLGGVINAFTSHEYTGFWMKLASEHYLPGFDLLSDLVSQPLIEPTEVDKERGVIVEELRMYEDQPRDKVEDNFMRRLFKDHQLGRPIIGNLTSLKRISAPKLKQFHKSWYGLDNMIVVVSGDQWSDLKTGLPKLSQQLFQAKTKHNRSYAYKKPLKKIIKQTKDLNQVYLCFGGPGVSLAEYERRLGLSLLNIIIARDFSSRLVRKIREERGLAYFIYNTQEAFTDAGFFVTCAGLRYGAVDEAVDIIRKEYEGIRRRKPGFELKAEELRLAKIKFKSRLLLSMEDSSTRAVFFGKQMLLTDRIYQLDEVFRLVDAIELTHLNNLAEELFMPDKLVLSLLGKV